MRQLLFFPVVLVLSIFLLLEGIAILGCPILNLIVLSITSLFHNYSSNDYLQPTVLAFFAYTSMPITINWLTSHPRLWKLFDILNIKIENLTELHSFVDGTINTLNLNDFSAMIRLSLFLGVVLFFVGGILFVLLEFAKKRQF